jgi:hypothetical protein
VLIKLQRKAKKGPYICTKSYYIFFLFRSRCQPQVILKRIKKFLECNSCIKARENANATITDWLEQYITHVVMSQEEKNNSVIQELRKHHSKGKMFKPILFGASFCWSCFAILHGMSLTTMKSMRALAKEDIKKWEHQGKNRSNHEAFKRKALKKFIQDLQDKFGI